MSTSAAAPFPTTWGAAGDTPNLARAGSAPNQAGYQYNPDGSINMGTPDAGAAELQQGHEQGLGASATAQGQDYGNQVVNAGNSLGAAQGNYGMAVSQTLADTGNTAGQVAGQQYGQLGAAQGQQGAALGNLANAAAGHGPTAADALLQQGTDAGINAQMAIARSSNGSLGAGNALKTGQQAGAQIAETGANNAAQLRAQEQQAAQQAYMAGSLGMGSQAAGAAQGAVGNQLNAYGIGSSAGMTGLQGQAATTLGALGSAESGMQTGEQIQQGYEGQGLNAQTQAANTSLGDATNATNVAMANSQQAAQLQGAAIGAGGAGLAHFTSDEHAKTEVRDAAKREAYGEVLSAAQEHPEMLGALGGQRPPAPPQAMPPPMQPQRPMMPPAAPPTGIQPQQAPPMAMTSDERAKVPAADGKAGQTEPPVDAFLGSLEPKTFSYKDPGNEPSPGGQGDRYLGIMAQDLESTPEGAKMVAEGPDGLKRVNVPALAGASAAALGRLHERLLALEGRHGAGVR